LAISLGKITCLEEGMRGVCEQDQAESQPVRATIAKPQQKAKKTCIRKRCRSIFPSIQFRVPFWKSERTETMEQGIFTETLLLDCAGESGGEGGAGGQRRAGGRGEQPLVPPTPPPLADVFRLFRQRLSVVCLFSCEQLLTPCFAYKRTLTHPQEIARVGAPLRPAVGGGSNKTCFSLFSLTF